MTKPNYTHITLVVDRSSSMRQIQSDAQQGINAFIKANQIAEGECTLALYQFDTVYEKVYGPGPITLAPAYVLTPRGNTALLDAQWHAIVDTGEYLARLPEFSRPSKVIFLTVTDGEENSSKELTGATGWQTLKEKTKEQKDLYNWEFTYIGADQDAFSVAEMMGVGTSVRYASSAKSTQQMYGQVTNSVLSARSTGLNVDYFMPESVDEEGNVTQRHPTSHAQPNQATTSTDDKNNS